MEDTTTQESEEIHSNFFRKAAIFLGFVSFFSSSHHVEAENTGVLTLCLIHAEIALSSNYTWMVLMLAQRKEGSQRHCRHRPHRPPADVWGLKALMVKWGLLRGVSNVYTIQGPRISVTIAQFNARRTTKSTTFQWDAPPHRDRYTRQLQTSTTNTTFMQATGCKKLANVNMQCPLSAVSLFFNSRQGRKMTSQIFFV